MPISLSPHRSVCMNTPPRFVKLLIGGGSRNAPSHGQPINVKPPLHQIQLHGKGSGAVTRLHFNCNTSRRVEMKYSGPTFKSLQEDPSRQHCVLNFGEGITNVSTVVSVIAMALCVI